MTDQDVRAIVGEEIAKIKVWQPISPNVARELRVTYTTEQPSKPSAESDEELVGRVAMAIFNCEGETDYPYEKASQGDKSYFRAAAKAALAAVKGGGGE